MIKNGEMKGEGRDMFGKKKTNTPIKIPEETNSVCQICGLDCRDKLSLQRHIDWAHKEQKTPSKP